MKRSATSVWTGSGKDGKGHLTSESGRIDKMPYSFSTRFGEEKGTNPEELIAAAHAGCFNMALSFALGKAGITPESLTTTAAVSIEKEGEGFTITTVDLDLLAKVPGLSEEKFQAIAADAKANCPVSKVLNAKISLKARLG